MDPVRRPFNPEAVGYASLTFAPLVGWVTMAGTWAVVDSEWTGGVDLGVMALGAGTAALAFGCYAAIARLPLPVAIRWSLASFGLTFAIALGTVLLLLLGLYALSFPAID